MKKIVELNNNELMGINGGFFIYYNAGVFMSKTYMRIYFSNAYHKYRW
ncbi:hypothetical protein [Oceanivirga salmonicida]|nr:hypothetical protein [Oceanivirga salmonicida]